MDKPTRNFIQKATQDARRLIEQEYAEQIEGTYDILEDGTIISEPGAHLDAAQRLIREKIIAAIEHERAKGAGSADSVATYLREAAFTTLNRFVALKMLEARGLAQECITKGEQSSGFREFTGLAPGLASLPDHGYRLYIESLFDEIGREVGVLFDRRDPVSLLWPRRQAFMELVDILNVTELSGVWGEDETIGWVYQYFNSHEERRAMRELSQAPRDSRELAVRNQFFTPRYVVEFLTDNTLGRIWYEMRQGNTSLSERCRYLVRRPNEIFLRPGENSSGDDDESSDLTQEELLKKPVYIEHRPKKDPRDIRVLDPACGSGHFLLYSFDLLEKIYIEAWEDQLSPKSEATGKCLREDFPDVVEFLREIPHFMLEHNLHGIDIDPRAVQIAALALWMRAQRSWREVEIKPSERPIIVKTNIVCAEPMPGEEDMRREFVEGLKPRVLGQIVESVFEKMKLAGEAGSLLKIESEIRDAVEKAKKQWQEAPKPKQLSIPGFDRRPKQLEIGFNVKGITDEQFWEQAEDRILDALKGYSQQAENGNAIRRRLFAEDAARGFAFIDLCQKCYDVVLMNPPFGEPPAQIQQYITSNLSEGRNDIYAALIVRCGSLMLPALSMLGAITSRAFVVGRDLRDYRAALLTAARPHLACLWDLGGGVLDGALVETCAYVLRWDGANELLYLDSRQANLKADEKEYHSRALTWNIELLSKFKKSPDSQFVFGDAGNVLASLENVECFIDRSDVTLGLTTEDDVRFIRSNWEINPRSIGSKWFLLTKGGDYSWYSSDVHLVVNRENEGAEMAAFAAQNSGNVAATRRSSKHYFKPAVMYSRRSQKGFSARRLRKGCCFSDKSGVIVPHVNNEKWLPLLPLLLSSSRYLGLIQAQSKFGAYEVGAVKRLPWPESECMQSHKAAEAIYHLVDQMDVLDETTSLFIFPAIHTGGCGEIMSKVLCLAEESLARLNLDIDEAVVRNQSAAARQRDAQLLSKASVLSFVVGTIYMRWDIRLALDPTLVPKLPPPFDPLPVCPPGMLVGADGLPAESGRIVSEDWLRARLDANNLPVEDAIKTPTIHDDGYPVRVSWDGIMVDDPGFNGAQPHRDDIVHRTHEGLELLWKDKALEAQQEACDILGVSDLRDYFRSPSGFFHHHLKRYSKSRRKAPIYWQLSTPSCSYSVWLYYHRFTKDTCYKVLNDYANPKLHEEERRLTTLHQDAGPSPTSSQRKEIAAHETLVEELRTFREEITRIAPLWNPNLNDGVIINFAPLWRLVPQHRQWQKECKDCWDKLVNGDYDWANLAMHLWPERVVPKCAADRSLAIAHGLEEALWAEGKDGKWRPKEVSPEELEKLIRERTSPTVKAALNDLLAAPAQSVRSGGNRSTRRRRSVGA